MSFNVENISETKKKITVEVPVERVNQEFNKLYSDLRAKAHIPGFRPGKVPKSVLKMRMGSEIATQIGMDLIEETYPEAVKSIEEEIVSRPEFNEWEVIEGEAFVYEVTLEILTEIELKNYKGMEVPKGSAEVTEEELTAGMENIQTAQTTYEVVEGRGAQEGDRVYGRITLTEGDDALPGWGSRHVEIDLGENKFFPDTDMEKNIVDAKVDEDHIFSITFAEDYAYYKDIAGKTIDVLLKVSEIKTKQIPEINDDLAKDMGLENMDELKDMIKGDILKKKEQEIETAFENAIFQAIEKENTIPAPDMMVTSEAEFMVDNYFSYQGQLPEEQKMKFVESMKPMAESRVKQRLILQRIAELENIEVSDEDIDKTFAEMAENEEGKTAEDIRKQWEDDNLLSGLKKQLLRSNALTWLKDNVTPVEPKDDSDVESDSDDAENKESDTEKSETSDKE